MLTAITFYVFAAILLLSACMVVSARNPVHAVLFLILTFFNAAGLFLLAGAEFLAMILVIVYVGAVAVLFLFVVMMLDINAAELRSGWQRFAPVGAAIGVILFAELMLVLNGWRFAPASGAVHLVPPDGHIQNTAALGATLYTGNVFLFQMAGLVLLVAMIGAIVLTLRDRTRSRHQDIGRQVSRRVEDTLAVVRVPLGAGVRRDEHFWPEPETDADHRGHAAAPHAEKAH